MPEVTVARDADADVGVHARWKRRPTPPVEARASRDGSTARRRRLIAAAPRPRRLLRPRPPLPKAALDRLRACAAPAGTRAAAPAASGACAPSAVVPQSQPCAPLRASARGDTAHGRSDVVSAGDEARWRRRHPTASAPRKAGRPPRRSRPSIVPAPAQRSARASALPSSRAPAACARATRPAATHDRDNAASACAQRPRPRLRRPHLAPKAARQAAAPPASQRLPAPAPQAALTCDAGSARRRAAAYPERAPQSPVQRLRRPHAAETPGAPGFRGAADPETGIVPRPQRGRTRVRERRRQTAAAPAQPQPATSASSCRPRWSRCRRRAAVAGRQRHRPHHHPGGGHRRHVLGRMYAAESTSSRDRQRARRAGWQDQRSCSRQPAPASSPRSTSPTALAMKAGDV